MNYFFLNITGFTLYSIYTTVGFFFPEVEGAGTVVIADLVFCYHAILMNMILTIQVLIYPSGKNTISFYSIGLCCALWLSVIVEVVFTEVSDF